MYHPGTAAESMHHDGSGDLPGIKDPDYNWDLRPHRDRIQVIDEKALKVWHSVLEDASVSPVESRMVYTVNTEAAEVLEKLAAAPRIRELGLQFSRGWDESIDKKKGYFDTGWAYPGSWNDAILQGPHLGVSTPMTKQPNPTLRHNQDWSEVDLEAMPRDFIPATGYQPDRITQPSYDSDYGSWLDAEGKVPVRVLPRICWRVMAGTTGFRTLYPCIIPPGTAHINGVISGASVGDNGTTVSVGAVLSSLLVDYQLRATGIANLYGLVIESLAYPEVNALRDSLISRYLQLNCLTEAYASLWEELMGKPWDVDKPLRKDEERRAAQVDIDAIVALSLGVTADELCMIYRTQFPVMRRYDQEDRFDANGRKVPKDVMKLQAKWRESEELPVADRTWVHPRSGVEYVFEYPFRQLDREADMREAYARFAEVKTGRER